MTARVYIAAGSNLGDRRASLDAAHRTLAEVDASSLRLLRRSTTYQTAAVGGPSGQGPYLNEVWEGETTLPPRAILDLLLAVERQLGRERREKWGPRTIDLDLLLYAGDILDEPGLTIPHPRLHERTFVLAPLAELAPDLVHPRLGRTVTELLRALPDDR